MRYRLKLDDDYFAVDVARIVSVCAKNGMEVSSGDARALWERHSDDRAAGWLIIRDDEEIIEAAEKYLEPDPSDGGDK